MLIIIGFFGFLFLFLTAIGVWTAWLDELADERMVRDEEMLEIEEWVNHG